MHFQQLANKSKSDAQPALRATGCVIELRKHVKYQGKLLRRDTNSSIRDADFDAGLVLAGSQSDLAARLGVFRGIAEYVPQGLSEPQRVSVHPYGHVRHVHSELVSALQNQRMNGLHGPGHEGGEVYRFSREIDLAPGD